MADTKKVTQKTTPEPTVETTQKTAPSIDWEQRAKDLEKRLASLTEKQEPKEEESRFDRQKLTRMVKGVFRYFENKGGTLKWADRFPWKGARVERYKARDNDTIELPLYVAERLMEKGKVPVMTTYRDSDRKPQQRLKEWRRRFEFFPFDEELLKKQRPDIIQVENM